VSGSVGALLVSPFNVEWGCYAWVGGVEVLEFCLFLVVFPARCISSVSPRFYFRMHAFCFLPLVAILESPVIFLKLAKYIDMETHQRFQIFFMFSPLAGRGFTTLQ
jgi:hypothetical protein